MNNLNNQNHFPYYPGMYMPPMQINNQNPAYYNEYQNFYYLNPPTYPLNQQMMANPYYPQFLMQQNTLEDSLNIMYNRGIVNNIIGAFFIKDCQDRQRQRKSEKRKVPISTVDLNDEQGDENMENNNGNNNEIGDESNNKLSYMVNDFKLKTEKEENEENNKNENGDENNSKEKEEETNEKKEEENKEENSEHNENELKKPNMM